MDKSLAIRETMLSQIGASETRTIVAANFGTRIANLGQNVTPLSEVMRYVFVLVGLKRENLPTEAEAMVIRQFIAQNYAATTVEEIKTAFDLAVKGELEVDLRHFQTFSTLYFAQVMKAYEKKKQKAMIEFARIQEREKLRSEVSTVDPEKAEAEFHAEMVVKPYQKFVTSKGCDFDIPMHSVELVYSRLKKLGHINLSEQDKQDIKTLSAQRFINQIEAEKAFKTMTDVLREKQGRKEDENKRWNRICQHKAIEITFEKLMKSGVKPENL